ncbi:MAG: sialidase family protein, partial [Anditalea sp.]
MKSYLNSIPNCHVIVLSVILLAMVSCHSSSKIQDDKSSKYSLSEASMTSDEFNYIFESGKDGYACYRIPAIVATNNGTLLAFAEGRRDGCSDTGDIDLLLKRSEDGGLTWSDHIVVWNDGGNTCGNPAPVVDQETGEVFLLATWNLGTDHERDIISGESEDTRRVFFLSSTDDGKSWSAPNEITQSVKKDNWTWYATGPVSGIQLKNKEYKGRLVIPCDFIEGGSKKAGSHIIYSDDHGKTWQLGGIAPHDQVNES